MGSLSWIRKRYGITIWTLIFEHIIVQPKVYRFLGSLSLFLSSCAILLTLLFAQIQVTYLLPFFAAIAFLGSAIMLAASVATEPLISISGSTCYAVGLLLFLVSTCIGVGTLASGVLGVIGMVVTLLGLFLIGKHFFNDKKLPVVHVQNFGLGGCIAFAFGCISFIVLNVSYIVSFLTVSTSTGLGGFGAMWFMIGTLLFVLSAVRDLSDSMTTGIFQFFYTSILHNSQELSSAFLVISLLQLFFTSICSSVLLLAPFAFVWEVFAFSSILMLLCVAVVVCFAAAGKKSLVIVFAELCYLSSFALLFAWSVLFSQGIIYASFCCALSSGASLAVSSILYLATFFAKFQKPLFGFGNLPFMLFTFRGAAAAFVLVFGSFGISSLAADSRWLTLFAVFNVLSQTCQVLWSSFSYDVAQVQNFSDLSYEGTSVLLRKNEDQEDLWGISILRPDEYDVFVCGGGPAGLTLSMELGLKEVKTFLAERRTAIVPDSRFFTINPATMEGLRRTDVDKHLREHAMPQDAPWGSVLVSGMAHPDVKVFSSTRAPSKKDFEELGSNMPEFFCSRSASSIWTSAPPQRSTQSVQEACIFKVASKLPSVDLQFGHEVLDFRLESDHILVLVRDLAVDSIFTIKCKYLVGCDGPTSTIAEKCNLKFDGFVKCHSMRSSYFKSPSLLAALKSNDVGVLHQYHIVRRSVGVGMIVCQHSSLGLFVFHLFALYDGRKPGEVTKEEFPGLIKEFLGPVEFEMVTEARWQWNFVVSRTFQFDERIFFCGDSCHAWPPFGGLAGNAAYQDVVNIAWKINANLCGWGGVGLLRSFNFERREQILRLGLCVMEMTPEPGRMATLGKNVWTFMKWAGLLKWYVSSSGKHDHNHFALEGVTVGLRYSFSPIVCEYNTEIPPFESTGSFVPKVVPGGRCLHVTLSDESSIQELIDNKNYTLLLCDEKLQHLAEQMRQQFQQENVPLNFHDVSERLVVMADYPNNNTITKHWRDAGCVMCRPDLYIGWVAPKNLPQDLESYCKHICRRLCGKPEIDDLLVEGKCGAALRWMTRRYIENTRPMGVLFPAATRLFNQPKAQDLRKATKAEQIGKSIELDPKMVEAPNKDVTVHGTDGFDALYKLSNTKKGVSEGGVEYQDLPCDVCHDLCLGLDFILINESRVHPRCISKFQKTKQVSCAQCGGAVVESSQRLMYNNAPLHTHCLLAYKASRKLRND